MRSFPGSAWERIPGGSATSCARSQALPGNAFLVALPPLIAQNPRHRLGFCSFQGFAWSCLPGGCAL